MHFLGKLHSSHLHELHLSSIGLTQLSLSVLGMFLSSPACYGIRSLHLNGNSLSNKGLKTLVGKLLVGNTTLFVMEAFANSVPEAETNEIGDIVSDEALLGTALQALTLVLQRNKVYLKRVEAESKALLVLARTLLLRQRRDAQPSINEKSAPLWQILPPELQHYTLRFVHISLSDAQHTRVCNYASDISTLPPFSPLAKYSKSGGEYIEDFLIVVGCNRFEGVLRGLD